VAVAGSVVGVFAVAHRAPPTAEACASLHRAGAEIFELDVQLSPRGVVVSHFLPLPRPLTRVERDNWRLRRARELAQDPLLDDALDVIPPTARVLLDLKEKTEQRRHELCLRLADELPGLTAHHPQPQIGRWLVSTESTADLAMLRAAGLHGWRTARGRRSLERLLAEPFDADGVTIRHTLLDQPTVDALRERTATVVAWTVNAVARARYLLDLGVCGITTDSRAVVEAVSAASAAAASA
jgi:glycerophosphoryl diester phosphodiesterase